jgi:hypothetical protein
MTIILGWVAIIALVLTLSLTIATILREPEPAKQFLELTKALLSWQVIAGGLAMGGGVMFKEEIEVLLARIL